MILRWLRSISWLIYLGMDDCIVWAILYPRMARCFMTRSPQVRWQEGADKS